MEIGAMFRRALDLSELTKTLTPQLDMVIALATQRAEAAGLYDEVALP